ncbi:VOC family protein [Dyadobacter arcticus]|uniref:Enzyme related to lactoylglutathione lyase n=1 Tax=Dyadobacter arcticus TaxID=1078754 RepID=A0ABX0UI04_9BACT|nr:VOC family protein [Dyadobacter arcticus]NIJ52653.1 putative enzyme related to lactoylglutathione lyase [Dyadobacter arcticus]
MENLRVRGLTGVIMSSPEPKRLVKFYKEVLGLPLELNRHGNTPDHWECDYNGIHYAVLPQTSSTQPNENIVLSFVVDDIQNFVSTHDIKLIHPIMDLGAGAYIASFKDPDGNILRFWMNKNS